MIDLCTPKFTLFSECYITRIGSQQVTNRLQYKKEHKCSIWKVYVTKTYLNQYQPRISSPMQLYQTQQFYSDSI